MRNRISGEAALRLRGLQNGLALRNLDPRMLGDIAGLVENIEAADATAVAEMLISHLGVEALTFARRLEVTTSVPSIAQAVTAEVERLLSPVRD